MILGRLGAKLRSIVPRLHQQSLSRVCRIGGGFIGFSFFPVHTLKLEGYDPTKPRGSSVDPPPEDVFLPSRPYPCWDAAWDSLDNESVAEGVCRHILLIRHGQYDETSGADDKRVLTALGRQQAELVGKRLSAMSSSPTGLRIHQVHCSEMARAKETADIIAQSLGIIKNPPDPNLNEGLPALPVPGWSSSDLDAVRVDKVRAEAAFQHYFHRERSVREDDTAHPCEVLVGHANILRYFVCRALQLPPEAWLRFHTFNCSITYLILRPDGQVQMRLLGDVGHLPEELITFSGRHGWGWYGAPTKCLPRSSVESAALKRDAA